MSEHTQLNIAGRIAQAFVHSKITAMVILAVTLAGLLALIMTPREYNPQIVVPAANILVAKPGASPQEISHMIVKPLEAIMNAQSGVKHTFGYATHDMGVVTLQFEVGEDQERSLVKMYNQLMQHYDRMPPGTLEPIMRPINVDDVPVMTLTLTSQTHDGFVLRDTALKLLEHLRNLPGVSFSEVIGGQKRAINVWLDADKLTSLGLSLDRVSLMLQGGNASMPVGELVNHNTSYPLRVSGYLGTPQEVGDVIIGVQEGQPIYLKDVAQIVDGGVETDTLSRIGFGPSGDSGHSVMGAYPAVTLALAKKSGTNAVEVTQSVLDKIEALKRSAVPEGIEIVVTRDDGAKADEAVNTLVEHLGIAILSVVVILVLFLGWREAGIVTLTVPLILFVVLVVGLIADQTLNRITLFALILSLGLLVDSAIVVIENIHRHLHEGLKGRPFDQVLIQATNEIGNPTNIATLAIILAFIPMAFVTGMMGPFMAPIPFNVPVAMIASLLIAYMVVPWVSMKWLQGKAMAQMQQTPPVMDTHSHKEDPLQKFYLKVFMPLMESSRKRRVFMGVVAAALMLSLLQPAWQFIRGDGVNNPLAALGVEVKMLPNDNTTSFLVQVDMPAGTALEATAMVAESVEHLLAQTEHVTHYQTFLGMAAPVDFAALVRGDMIKRGPNLAQIRVNLTGKTERSKDSHTIAGEFERALSQVRAIFPEARLKIYETPPGPPVQAQILAELYGPDYDQLRAAAEDVTEAFKQVYGIINVDNSVTQHAESYEIQVDREKAMLVGVAPAQVAKMLREYVSGFSIGTFHAQDAREPVDILVRLPRTERASPQQLMNLSVTSQLGHPVLLSTIAQINRVTQAKPIFDRDQHPFVFVSGELMTSSPVYAVLALDKMLDQVKLKHSGVTFSTSNLGFVESHPDDVTDYNLLWGGEMRLTLDVFRDMGSAFMVAIVFIYFLLVGYYKSFRLPLIVMGAIPLTMIGIFPGHWVMGQAFTATSMIGFIALAGIVVRNSLLLIDFVLDYRAQGYSVRDAVIEAGKVRFRPILLTALAIILGSAIMITDPVFGGLAVSLIFGTFASTALTLVVIPLLYYRWQRHHDGEKAPA